jgi:hypothetical protein
MSRWSAGARASARSHRTGRQGRSRRRRRGRDCIFLRIEQIGDGAQNGEHRRHLRALFLGEDAVRRLTVRSSRRASKRRARSEIVFGRSRMTNRGAPRRARYRPRSRHRAAIAGNPERRIDDGGIPAGVAARIFVVGGKHRARHRFQAIPTSFPSPSLAVGAFRSLVRKSKWPPGNPVAAITIFTRTRFKRPLSAGPPPNVLERSRVHGKSIARKNWGCNWICVVLHCITN